MLYIERRGKHASRGILMQDLRIECDDVGDMRRTIATVVSFTRGMLWRHDQCKSRGNDSERVPSSVFYFAYCVSIALALAAALLLLLLLLLCCCSAVALLPLVCRPCIARLLCSGPRCSALLLSALLNFRMLSVRFPPAAAQTTPLHTIVLPQSMKPNE